MTVYVQGAIYIYTMAGKPVKEAKLIESKIGVVTGLTLDPIKQVGLGLKYSYLSFFLRFCSGPTRRGWLCGTAPTREPTVGSSPLQSRCNQKVSESNLLLSLLEIP